jgi:hypothetical protein
MERRRNRPNKIGIYINSSGRPHNIKTFKQFPEKWADFVYIVVPNEQTNEYRRAKENKGWEILPVPSTIPQYLSSQRQWIMENSPYDYVWLMDDDLTFQIRYDGVKLKNSSEEDMGLMYSEVCKAHCDDGIPMVGISTRLGNNRVTESFADISRITRCYSLSREVFDEVGAKFNPFEPFLMQDFHLTLSWLKSGYRNRVFHGFAQGDSGSNTSGGVSVYRTPELMEKVANFLANEHRGLVKVTKKKTKGSWAGFPTDKDGNVVRTDVTVYWKKAHEQGKRKETGISRFF